MSDLQSLYQTIILEHSKARHGAVELTPLAEAVSRGAVSGLTVAESHQINTTCGDEVTLRVSIDAETVTDLVWAGEGCSISQASASMLVALLREDGGDDGMPKADAEALIGKFREALRSRGKIPLDEETFADAAALSGVSKYTARVKCAMLAWVALEEGLRQA